MARRKTRGKAAARKPKVVRAGTRARSTKPSSAPAHFVGRAGSPILDKYPTKAMDAAVGEVVKPKPSMEKPTHSPPPTPSDVKTVAATSPPSPPAAPAPKVAAPNLLISLEKPFDADDFSQLLGHTQIQVTVPRDSLSEVLRRACDFMGFGIYVYTIRVRPGPEELLKTFIVELQRVDFSPLAHEWTPFQDRGRADNPFGPTGTR